MGQVFVFSLTAAPIPTLLAAVTAMLALEKPRRLLIGYLLGALVTSITCGLLLVFALPGSSASSTAKHSVKPVLTIALGALILLVVFVVGSGRDRRRRAWSEHRRERATDKPPPRWRRLLSKGSARGTFVVGVLLSFPGASYIAAMTLLHKQHIGTTITVLAVLASNLIMLILLELPLLGYVVRPEWTADAVQRFSSWLTITNPTRWARRTDWRRSNRHPPDRTRDHQQSTGEPKYSLPVSRPAIPQAGFVLRRSRVRSGAVEPFPVRRGGTPSEMDADIKGRLGFLLVVGQGGVAGV
jgi:hypothetical protein